MNHKQLIQEASLEKKDFVFIRFQNKTIHKMDEELCSNQIQIYTYTTKSSWKWTQRTTEKDRENSRRKNKNSIVFEYRTNSWRIIKKQKVHA